MLDYAAGLHRDNCSDSRTHKYPGMWDLELDHDRFARPDICISLPTSQRY